MVYFQNPVQLTQDLRMSKVFQESSGENGFMHLNTSDGDELQWSHVNVYKKTNQISVCIELYSTVVWDYTLYLLNTVW